MENILEMKGINKFFGSVHALKNIEFSVRKGETMALVGENGAGKSTLMKILTGAYTKDSGDIRIEEKSIEKNSTAVAKEQGISQVYQIPELVPELTVAENICLGDLGISSKGIISWKRMFQKVETFLQMYRIPIHAKTPVKELSAAMRQFVAIGKVLYQDPKVIIFDEPTAVLSDSEVSVLFEIISKLKEEKRTIIYISHRLEEIFKLADRVSVMRDGAMVAVMENRGLTKDMLISNMLGKQLGAMFAEKAGIKSEDVVLELEHVSTKKIHDISFKLRKGEILGIIGLVGSGRTETANAIFGVDKILSGKIKINGKEEKIDSTIAASRAGIFLAPEDRKNEAMILCRSIRENISLSKLSFISTSGICNNKKEREHVERLCKDLKVKMASVESPVQDLSGGNQQKVVIAKAFTADPQILIFDEPTQGIDVGAKAEIYILLEKLRRKGKSIILISSEIEEIQGTCDRTIVLRNGRVTGEMNEAELKDTEKVLHNMYKEV